MRPSRIWIVAAGGTFAALMCLALAGRSEDAAGTAVAGAAIPGAAGAGAAATPRLGPPAPPLESDALWRQRMNRIDRRARAELGLDDATAQRLDSLQQRLRVLVEDARGQLGIGGVTRAQVETRIRQRTGGFRAQVGQVLGSRAKSYLRIVQESRAGS